MSPLYLARIGLSAAGNFSALLVLVLLLITHAAAGSKLSPDQREQVIRAFLDERVFAHRVLPLGGAGIVVEGDKITPPPAEVNQLVEHGGAAARPGERVQITAVRFVRDGILFEINGGSKPHRKWTDHVSAGMGIPDLSDNPQPGESIKLEPTGSSVMLKVDDASGLTADRIKTLLAPVLDFQSVSQADAYQNNLAPVLAAALKEHRALVGMDRDMVLSALGRPPRRLRETSDGAEYEEWIYGSPPQDVQFIRFQRGKVVRIEEMKITGEKSIRTQDEVAGTPGAISGTAIQSSGTAPAMAAPTDTNATAPEAARRTPPTLRRPGESLPGPSQDVHIPLPASVPQPDEHPD